MSAPDVQRIVLDGEWDLTRREEIAALFELSDGEAPLVIDMSALQYVDSSILHEIGRLRAANVRRSITLAGPNRHIQRVLHIVGFDRIFTLADSDGEMQ